MEKQYNEPYRSFIDAGRACLADGPPTRLYLVRGTAVFVSLKPRAAREHCADLLDRSVTELACRLIRDLQYICTDEQKTLDQLEALAARWAAKSPKKAARLEAKVRALLCQINEEPIVAVSSSEEEDESEAECPLSSSVPATPRIKSRYADAGLAESLLADLAAGDHGACSMLAAILEFEQGQVLLNLQAELSTLGSRLSRRRRLERGLSEVSERMLMTLSTKRKVSFKEQLEATLAKTQLQRSHAENLELVKRLVAPLKTLVADLDFRANALVAQLLQMEPKERAGMAGSLVRVAALLLERQSYHSAATVYLALSNAVTVNCGKHEGWYEALSLHKLDGSFAPAGNFRVNYRRMSCDLQHQRPFFPFAQPLVSNVLGLLENPSLEADNGVVRKIIRMLSAGCAFAEDAQALQVSGIAAALRAPGQLFDPSIDRDSSSLDAVWQAMKPSLSSRGSRTLKRLCSTCSGWN